MGLGASFGGDAGTSLFGTSTADVLKTITAWMIGIFMGASFLLSTLSSIDSKKAAPVVQQVEESGEKN
jgi:preprotein translocase subunit SecG